MIDVVVLVRRLFNGVLERFERGMINGRALVVMQQVVASVTDRRRRQSLCLVLSRRQLKRPSELHREDPPDDLFKARSSLAKSWSALDTA